MSGPVGGRRAQPARLLDPSARAQLTGAEARLAELFARAPTPQGLDDHGLARVHARLRGPARSTLLRAWRVGLAAGALLTGMVGVGLAARYAGLPLPFVSAVRAPAPPPRARPPRPSPPPAPPAPAVVAPPPAPPAPAVAAPPPLPPGQAPVFVPARPASVRPFARGSAPHPRPLAIVAPVRPVPADPSPQAPPLPPLAPPSLPSPSAAPPAPASLPEPERPPVALASEASLLQEALGHLRLERDGRAALEVLDRYAAFHPAGVLAPEAARARVDALFLLGQRQQARRQLETLTLEARGRDLELSVVRGELRAEAGDLSAAERDFSRVLGARAPAALAERALHGRAVCRQRRGDAAGAARDFAAYRRRFPGGRFAPRPPEIMPPEGL
jgi:hypothetical protein